MNAKPVNQKAWWLVLPVVLLVGFNAIIPLMTVVQVAGIAIVLCAHGFAPIADLAGLIANFAARAIVSSSHIVDAAPWSAPRVPPPPLWLLLASFYKVKKSTPRWFGFAERAVAGAIHAIAHLLAFGLVALAAIAIVDGIGLEGAGFTIVAGLLVLVFGAVVGSLVFGAYLVVALAVFKRHANENFSASRYETYKNFLRLHIGRDGVTVYPIGIDKPCTQWKVAAQSASVSTVGATVVVVEPSSPVVVVSATVVVVDSSGSGSGGAIAAPGRSPVGATMLAKVAPYTSR